MDFLKRVKKYKLQEIEELKTKIPEGQVKYLLLKRDKFYSFKHAIEHPGRISIISEVKYASPSKGKIRDPKVHKPIDIALEYQGSGADAISVLTDIRFFMGSYDYLSDIRDFVDVPLLCKDFILDEYQIKLARAMGADAILLIAAFLEDAQMKDLYDCAKEFGCDVLFEVHNLKELDRVMKLDPVIIGVNSRDLTTLQVDVARFAMVIPHIPEEKIRVAESGITSEVLPFLKQLRVDAVLVGEYLMRQNNIHYSLRRFVEGCFY